MPMFHMDQREWVELTDDQVAFARMALDDCKALGDPPTAAILILRKACPGLTLKQVCGAVAYARQHPDTTSTP